MDTLLTEIISFFGTAKGFPACKAGPQLQTYFNMILLGSIDTGALAKHGIKIDDGAATVLRQTTAQPTNRKRLAQ
jgi:hypothetical protein